MEKIRLTTGMKRRTLRIFVKLTSLLVLIVPRYVYAGTLTVGPTDCSASAVNSAIAAASDGDTVVLTCTGSVTWTSTVTIPGTKGITLKGPGNNTPKSSATFPLTITFSAPQHAILLTCGPNHPVSRITGFKFNGDVSGVYGYIKVTGYGTGTNGLGGFRIDNNYFDQVSGDGIIGIFSYGGPLYGLVDNNSLVNCWRSNNSDYGPYGIMVWNWWRGDQCWGGSGWTDPFKFGDQNFTFIEDNLFENTTKYMRHFVSSELGGRYVTRHNIVNVTATNSSGGATDPFDAHGFCLCESNGAGSRGGEIYANQFKGTKYGRPVDMRGGHWLIYDNTFESQGVYGAPIAFLEYRAGDSGLNSQCSSTCPCTSPWYPQVTDNPSRYPLPQQITKTYVWNNLSGGVNVSPVVDSGGYQSFYIQKDRDYFVSTSKPSALSYTPYTYPHPLRGSVPSAPSAPTGLRIIP